MPTTPDAAFDIVVVGAGPAGSAAALEAARAGKRVALLERGPYPGAKNVYGGVVYGRILDELVPRWWDRMPVQRWVTRRSTMMLTPTQALTVDFRTEDWGRPPYNGATVHRADLDGWLAGLAQEAGAVLVPSTTATGLLRGPDGAVTGVRTDRPGGDLTARVVIACDGVNSFLAKEAGLFDRVPGTQAQHTSLGVKEVLALPREAIEERFGLTGRHGQDIEIIGCTGGIPGGGFLYTGLDTVSVGVVLSVTGLAASGTRPEEVLAGLKSHSAIAPLLRGGEVKEYSAHLIPEGGHDTMPELATDGLLVAGDAAAMCLAAGIWLEGVNYALGAGMYAGRAAAAAVTAGDTTKAGLAGYRRALEDSFVLADLRKLRQVPELVFSDRVQRTYPGLLCDLAQDFFTVDNPRPKPGLRRLVTARARARGLKLRHLLSDALTGARSFG
ncbi:FAD-dependent oxidoreductase (plasmid) [Streptomyces yangpuensis]|uniref:FAD-dependent oxidoreductase n=1 Tax=Streptomyces yangpuensis TaxID=1648182 RepID=A0ABY5Q8H1_9ACTN|nr:FAD-dependent oxidoreductase [Streptomyces yangpuensis]UUY52480.1 FAD-dependent oxidoreductase [Streptomyces yangpuensis]